MEFIKFSLILTCKYGYLFNRELARLFGMLALKLAETGAESLERMTVNFLNHCCPVDWAQSGLTQFRSEWISEELFLYLYFFVPAQYFINISSHPQNIQKVFQQKKGWEKAWSFTLRLCSGPGIQTCGKIPSWGNNAGFGWLWHATCLASVSDLPLMPEKGPTNFK